MNSNFTPAGNRSIEEYLVAQRFELVRKIGEIDAELNDLRAIGDLMKIEPTKRKDQGGASVMPFNDWIKSHSDVPD